MDLLHQGRRPKDGGRRTDEEGKEEMKKEVSCIICTYQLHLRNEMVVYCKHILAEKVGKSLSTMTRVSFPQLCE